MKDPTVDSHACQRSESSDPSHASHHSLPQCSAEDLAAGVLSRLNFIGSSMLQVALVTADSSIISLRKLGRSQGVFNGVILDWEQAGCRSVRSAVHWMGCCGGKMAWAGEDAEKHVCRYQITWLDVMFLVSK